MTVGLGVRSADMSDFTAKKPVGGYHAGSAEPPFGTIADYPAGCAGTPPQNEEGKLLSILATRFEKLAIRP